MVILFYSFLPLGNHRRFFSGGFGDGSIGSEFLFGNIILSTDKINDNTIDTKRLRANLSSNFILIPLL